MLPGFRDSDEFLEKKFHSIFLKRMRSAAGVVGQLQHTIIHEGKKSKVVNAGWTDDIELNEISTQFTIDHQTVAKSNVEEFIRRVEEAADDMARQQSQHFYSMMDRVTNETGNVVDGRSDLIEAVFEMFEKVQMDFERDGSLKPGFQIIAAPEKARKLEEAFDAIQTDSKLTKRWNKILDRQRERWRDREAARVLVE